MHFTVFIPGHLNHPVDQLADVGLPDLVESAQRLAVHRGPDGQQGTLFGWRTKAGGLNMLPDQKQWIPATQREDFAAGRYWVGLDPDQLPSPTDLCRAYPFMGPICRLGDGRTWMIPRPEMIPATMRRDDDGSWRFVPQRQYVEFCMAAEQMKAVFDGLQVGGSLLYGDLAEFCESALRINYRVTPEVCDLLGLWTSGYSGSCMAVGTVLDVIKPHMLGLPTESALRSAGVTT